MFTSSPLHTDTYPESANLPPLRRDWLANYVTILTVRAVSHTLCSSLDMLVDWVGCPYASEKILVDFCSVWMKGYPIIPAWDVHAVSQDSESIDPSITPCLTCCSVSLSCGRFSVLFLCTSYVRLCGCCRHFFLYWYRWCWGRVKRT